MTTRSCFDCQFFDRRGLSKGLCRVSSPMPVEDRNNPGTYVATWPEVHEEDWCGAYVGKSPSG